MICKYCKTEQSIVKTVDLPNNDKEAIYSLSCKHTAKYPIPIVEEYPLSQLLSYKEASTALSTKWSLKIYDEKTDTHLEPRTYQYEGIEFAEQALFRCLIADEMGLGKTIQAIGTIIKNKDKLSPILVLVKSSLKMQWMVELFRWGGRDFIPQILEDAKLPILDGFNVYIASYDILRRFSSKSRKKQTTAHGMEITVESKDSPIYDYPFKTIILDEVQSIKSQTSSRTDEVKNICEGKENIIALSGTPIKNNAAEYFTILNILYPDKFPSLKSFTYQWVEENWNGRFKTYGGIKYPKEFKEYTKKFIIRRKREEVAKELPKINRVFYHVDFESEKLKRQYESAENEFIRSMESALKNRVPINIIAEIATLRHIVGVNKINPTVDQIAEFLLTTDRKLVVFTQHEDVMKSIHLLTTKLALEGGFSEPLLFHSGLSAQERHALVSKFKDDNVARVMIASTLAAGEGLNLQFCSDCIFVERQWNPANEEQAEGRFIRIGQTADRVDATYMVASNTIDEYFTELVEKKRAHMKSTLDGEISVWQEEGLMKELMGIMMGSNRKKVYKGW